MAQNKKLKIKAVVRYNREWNSVELFWVDEHKQLVSYSPQEGHNDASYEYYLSCMSLKSAKRIDGIQERADALVKIYNDDETELIIQERIKMNECSYLN